MKNCGYALRARSARASRYDWKGHLSLNLSELFLQVDEFFIPFSGTAMPLSRWCLTGRDITGKAKKQHSALGVWFTKYMLCENA